MADFTSSGFSTPEDYKMKRKFYLVFVIVLLTSFAIPNLVYAKELQDDKIVAGGTFILASGDTLDGNLLIFGGSATLEKDSQVNGDVALMGGTLNIDGRVTGNVVGLGGVVNLGQQALVEGDLTMLAATLNRDEGSRVNGQIVNGLQTPFHFEFPGVTVPSVQPLRVNVLPIWNVMWFFFRTFLWAALAVLVAMFLPAATRRTAEAIVKQPVLVGGVGLITTIVTPLLLIGIAITIILIPISLVGALAMAVAWFFGRIVIGYEVGKRFAEMLKQDWPIAVAAGIGTFILALVVDGANELIPCVGWLFPVMVGILGLGAVILTRFGTQTYPPTGIRPLTPTTQTGTGLSPQGGVESPSKPEVSPPDDAG
jgi:hypothetical protein